MNSYFSKGKALAESTLALTVIALVALYILAAHGWHTLATQRRKPIDTPVSRWMPQLWER